jgi:AcrR family transcriptional regulator
VSKDSLGQGAPPLDTPPRPETRRAAQAARSRVQILDAALAAIEEVGLEHASASEIARRAGMTWGAIQHHFGSRDELLLALIERNFWQLEADVRALPVARGSVLDRLQAIADLIWAYCRNPRYFVSWEIILSMRRHPDGSQQYGERLARMGPAFASAWEELFVELLGSDTDRNTLTVLFAAMRGFAMDRHTNPSSREFTQERAFIVRLLAEDLERHRPAAGAH